MPRWATPAHKRIHIHVHVGPRFVSSVVAEDTSYVGLCALSVSRWTWATLYLQRGPNLAYTCSLSIDMTATVYSSCTILYALV